MNLDDLDLFLERNPNVEWTNDDDGNFYFRHAQYDGPNDKIKVEPKALKELTAEKLEQVLIGGRNVDHITRVTGYFSRVAGWNKGKRGELVDRQRVKIS